MIRRDLPRTNKPSQWLLIPQREHARLSYELAAAWGNRRTEPLVCPADSINPALLAVRNELLGAIRLHDEGWADWEAAPGVDPDHHRPFGFTEMRPAEAQRLWSASIDACRQLGPLAGWVVAGHFVRLQSPRDDDYPQWEPWLAQQQQSRELWLAEWLAQDKAHTLPLARHALFYLRAFDWISLWICCRAPLCTQDPEESMELSEDPAAFGRYELRAHANRVTVAPWPFSPDHIEASVACRQIPLASYSDSAPMLQASKATSITWRLSRP